MRRLFRAVLTILGALAVLLAVDRGIQGDSDTGMIAQAEEELPLCVEPWDPTILCICTPETPDSHPCIPEAPPCSNGDCYAHYCNEAGKVALCHNGHDICVSPNAGEEHLQHGDLEGGCYQQVL